MITIEEVKKEYFRVEEFLKREAISTTEYSANAKQGYSIHCIKRVLGLTYNAMKKAIGAKEATSQSGRNAPQLSAKKIHCKRGGVISIDECIPGCNDLCNDCGNRQIKNIKASSDTLTYKEEESQRHEGIRGVGYSEMIEPYAEI